MDFKNLTIKEARKLLDSKSLSVKELVEYYLKNIEIKNKEINAYLEVFDDIKNQTKVAQDMIDKNKSKPLTGIPIAIKDNILIKGRKVSAASKMLENYRAIYDSTVAKKLIDQGVVFLGRTNLDEFAMGGSTENSAFGVTRNPFNISRVAGGSSGGSAAALAGDMCLASVGSDTGGSVREPASFCGIVGLKPTYGSVSRYGLIAMGSSLDVIGPMTKTVIDSEIIFDVIKGKDKMDSTSIEIENSKLKIKNLSIGVPYNLVNQKGVSKEVKENFDQSIKKLKDLGYRIIDIDLPNIDKALAVYYIIMPAEVSSNMARFDGQRYGFSKYGDNLLEIYKKTRGEGLGKEVRRRIILGTYVLSTGYYDAYYGKALQVRKIIREEFNEAFKNVNAVLTPTVPSPAFKIGEKLDPLEMYLADIFTVTANIVGCPAISIPSGFVEVDGKSLPLGIQLMSPHLREDILFDIGKKFLNE